MKKKKRFAHRVSNMLASVRSVVAKLLTQEIETAGERARVDTCV